MRKHHLVMQLGMGHSQKKRMAATVVIKSRVLTSLESSDDSALNFAKDSASFGCFTKTVSERVCSL
jgi:hypothetical protein